MPAASLVVTTKGRRDELGGIREVLVHQTEEPTCLRMLAEGRLTRLGDADPLLHFESPRRDRRRQFRPSAAERSRLMRSWPGPREAFA